MKTVFDKATRDELITRIEQVNENSERQWGKMTVFQMLKHCTIWEGWILKSQPNKVSFAGRIFGKMALKSMLKEGKLLPRNTPTSKPFIATGSGNVEAQKAEWIALINQYGKYVNHGFVHDFFGKMSTEQVGYLAYKHTDHHLRQFNS